MPSASAVLALGRWMAPGPRAGLFGRPGNGGARRSGRCGNLAREPHSAPPCGEILTQWGLSALLGICESLQKAGRRFHQGATSVKRRISNREVRRWGGEERATLSSALGGQPHRLPERSGAEGAQPATADLTGAATSRGGGAPGLGNQPDTWARAAGPQLGVGQACAQPLGSLSPDRPP